jgi:hypothetical protein
VMSATRRADRSPSPAAPPRCATSGPVVASGRVRLGQPQSQRARRCTAPSTVTTMIVATTNPPKSSRGVGAQVNT